MLVDTSDEIGKALFMDARRRAGEVSLNTLTRQIDGLLWELEALNLKDCSVVPDELLPRIRMAVAAATETVPMPTAELRQPMVALDRLFEAQGGLAKLKCRHRGFAVHDGDDAPGDGAR